MALDLLPWRELGWSLVLGWWAGLLYDICQLLGRQARRRRWARTLLDAVFWLLLTATLVFFLLQGWTSELRLYLFLGMALGWYLYRRVRRWRLLSRK
ncbi:spore cortex biosynthesis protein YabQ [Desulfothermobacter acidiphilus]|uniref:spore cortex biosynthesis protein YabQ n=1 Tax=Desulfothermobacter acidiphilus TaxID=1938353 RepID=UPI003F8933A3